MKTRCLWLAFSLVGLVFLGADAPDQRAADKEALAALQPYVGGWRGVGQLRRGSNQGAWIEQCEWAWKFTDNRAGLSFSADKGKYFTAGTLRAASKAGQFELVAETPGDAQHVTYRGQLDEQGQLVLLAEKPDDTLPTRVSIRLVAEGDRMVVLYERRTAADQYVRLAEVGSTRQGSDFGKGTSFVECVVTGGKGTIAVTFEGKTYYVCCSGCRDLFNDDPAAALTEYRERKEAEKATPK
jgi:YHS domain-containing protein